MDVEEPGTGGRTLTGERVRERDRVGVGVVMGGGLAGVAGAGGDSGGLWRSFICSSAEGVVLFWGAQCTNKAIGIDAVLSMGR